MTSMYGNHGLKFDRFGEEIDGVVEKRINYIKNVGHAYFCFDKNYIVFRNRRLVNVAPAIDTNDKKKQLSNLERKLEKKISKMNINPTGEASVNTENSKDEPALFPVSSRLRRDNVYPRKPTYLLH